MTFAINALTANYVLASSAKAVEQVVMWKKPTKGCYKLNTDACFHVDGSGAVGIVLRDDHGVAIAGYTCPLDHVLDAATTEALALLKGIEFLEQVGITRAHVESDSLELIQACNAEIEVWGPYDVILAECFIKAHQFDSIVFEHCPGDANQVAHELTKHFYNSKSGCKLGWRASKVYYSFCNT
jgi:ribonuclease HI